MSSISFGFSFEFSFVRGLTRLLPWRLSLRTYVGSFSSPVFGYDSLVTKIIEHDKVSSLLQTPSPPCLFRSGISFVTVLIFLRARFIGKGNEAVVVCNRTIHLSSGMRKYFSYKRPGNEKCVAKILICTFQSHAHSE